MIGILFLSSCLKDSPVTTDFSVVKPVIEQLNSPNFSYSSVNGGELAANQNSYFMQVRVDSTGSAPDSVVVNIAGSTISKDVTVTIAIDTVAFNTFNANNGGTYVMVPSAAYTIASMKGTIKAGTQQVGEASAGALLHDLGQQAEILVDVGVPGAWGEMQGAGAGDDAGGFSVAERRLGRRAVQHRYRPVIAQAGLIVAQMHGVGRRLFQPRQAGTNVGV